MGVVRRQINRHAARLRREMTDAERALWSGLRNWRLEGFKFRSQWSLGPYVADFCCLAARLIVEVDGGQHTEKKGAKRSDWLKANGFRVLRLWNNDVLTNLDGVLLVIADALEGRGSREEEQDPHPNQYQVNIAPRCSDYAGGTIDLILPRAGEGEPRDLSNPNSGSPA